MPDLEPPYSVPPRFTHLPEVQESLSTINKVFTEMSDNLHRLDRFGKKLSHSLLYLTDPSRLGSVTPIGTNISPVSMTTPPGIERELGVITGNLYTDIPSRSFTDQHMRRVITPGSLVYPLTQRGTQPFTLPDRDPSLHVRDIPIYGHEGTPTAIARIAISGAAPAKTLENWVHTITSQSIPALQEPIDTLRDRYLLDDHPPLSFFRSLELGTPADPNCHVIEFDVTRSTETMLQASNGALDAFLGTLKRVVPSYITEHSLQDRAVYIGNGGDNARLAFSIPASINRADPEKVTRFIDAHITPHIQVLRQYIAEINAQYPEFTLKTSEATGFMEREPNGEFSVIPLWEIAKDKK